MRVFHFLPHILKIFTCGADAELLADGSALYHPHVRDFLCEGIDNPSMWTMEKGKSLEFYIFQ